MKYFCLVFTVLGFFYTSPSYSADSTKTQGYLWFAKEVAGGVHLAGWSCQTGVETSNKIKVYAEDSFGKQTLIQTMTSDVPRQKDISDLCKTKSSRRGFDFVLPEAKYAKFSEQKILVFSMEVSNLNSGAQVPRSGTFRFPKSVTPPEPPPVEKPPVEPPPVTMPPEQSSSVSGYLWFAKDVPGGVHLAGWSCQVGVEASNKIKIYAEDNSGKQTFIHSLTSNVQRTKEISDLCKTNSAYRGFDFILSKDKFAKFSEQKILIYSMEVANLDKGAEVPRSGEFRFPKVTLPPETPPTNPPPVEPPPAVKPPEASNSVSGYLWFAREEPNGIRLAGWSCQTGVDTSNSIKVYAEDDAGNISLIQSMAVNLPRMKDIADLCKTNSLNRGYDFVIPVSKFKNVMGQKILVYGLEVTNTQRGAQLARSGEFRFPIIETPIEAINLSDKARQVNYGDIEITAGEEVVIDKSIEVGKITIKGGRLTCPRNNESLKLISNSIMVMGSSGVFECGTPLEPFLGQFDLQIKPDKSPDQAGNMGERVVGAMNGGTISLHGNSSNTKWTKLAQSVSKYGTTLNLAENPGWNVGDTIAIGPTGFVYNEGETAVIKSISASGKVINLQSPLRYNHLGVIENYNNGKKSWDVDMRAEVINLSRNINIRPYGENSSLDSSKFGAHIMIMNGAFGYLDSVGLDRMGQMGVMARYPFHWHRAGNVDGQYIKNSSITNSYQRCVTVHGAHKALVENNVCYNHFSHGYFLEDGDETENKFFKNVGMVSKRPPASKALLESDHMSRDPARFDAPATFWISNPENYFEGNVASGSQGTGFWLTFESMIYCETFFCRYVTNRAEANVFPAEQTTLQFDNNIAHSTNVGFTWDGTPRGELTNNPNNPNDRQITNAHYFGKGPSNPDGEVPTFNNLTAYKNVYSGVYVRADTVKFNNFMFADNGVSIFVAFNQIFKDSLVAGLSRHVTSAEKTWHLRHNIWGTKKIRGFITYDGPAVLDNVYFADFPEEKVYAMGTEITPTPIHAFGGATHYDHQVINASFEGDPYYKVLYDERGVGWQDFKNHIRIVDVDGSLYGTPGNLIVPDHEVLNDPTCSKIIRAKAMSCDYDMGTFVFEGTTRKDGGATNALQFTTYRNDGAQYGPFDPSKFKLNNKFGAILNKGYSYSVEFSRADHTRLGYRFEATQRGQMSPVISFPGWVGCSVVNSVKVNTMSELNQASASNVHFVDSRGLVHARSKATDYVRHALSFKSKVTLFNCN